MKFLTTQLSKHFSLDRVNPAQFSDEVAMDLMRERVGYIFAYTRVMTIASYVFAVALTAFFWGRGSNVELTLWCVLVLSGHAFAHYCARKGPSAAPSKQTRPKLSVEHHAIILAVASGIGPFLLLPLAIGSEFALIAAGSCCSLAIGAYVLHSVPKAALAWLGTSTLLNTFSYSMTGEPAMYFVAAFGFLSAYGIARACVAHCVRMTEKFLARNELKEKQEIIGLLLKEYEDNSGAWLWECDHNANLTRVPPPVLERMGLRDVSELPSLNFCELAREHESNEGLKLVQRFEELAASPAPFHDVHFPVRDPVTHRLHWLSVHGNPKFDSGGEFAGYRGIVTDVTEAKNAENHIRFLAEHDPLTKLPNRTTYSKRIWEWVHGNKRFASLHLDLDRFKQVNDSLGHSMGDELLKQVAHRIQDVASMSGQTCHIARMGGDEFLIGVLLDDEGHDKAAQDIAEAIVRSLSQPFELTNGRAKIGTSVGYIVYPEDGTDVKTLVESADLALYRAKEEGRNRWVRFTSELSDAVHGKKALQEDLSAALRRDQFHLVYQPLVNLEQGKVCGVEALLRWTHPTKTITPDEFIPLAEESGAIIQIGEWVLRTACEEAASWAKPLTVAVNISAKQILSENFVETVIDILEDTEFDPARLELELTETVLVQEKQRALEAIVQLRNYGIAVVLDDFGTGFSSLSYLRDFSFDKIKIDKSFIGTMTSADSVEQQSAEMLVTSIVNLGKNMGMKVTAEGVEIEKQVECLRNMGCDVGQGYLFARPMVARDLKDFASLHPRKRATSLPKNEIQLAV